MMVVDEVGKDIEEPLRNSGNLVTWSMLEGSSNASSLVKHNLDRTKGD